MELQFGLVRSTARGDLPVKGPKDERGELTLDRHIPAQATHDLAYWLMHCSGQFIVSKFADLFCWIPVNPPYTATLSVISIFVNSVRIMLVLTPIPETQRRPPGVSPTTFHAQPPNIRLAPLTDMDFAV